MEDDELILRYRRQKKNFNILLIFFGLIVFLNLIILPVSIFIGGMATDSPGSGFREFVIGFSFVQILPLVMFLVITSIIIVFLRRVKRLDFMKSFFKLMIVLNIIIMPVSIYIGINAMHFHDGQPLGFIYGFLFIQTIPLLITLIGILGFKALINRGKVEEQIIKNDK